MEHQPSTPEGNEEQYLSGEIVTPAEAGARSGEMAPPLTVEFGYLEFTSPDGGSWEEHVVNNGIEAAEREQRPIDDRTACYIAWSLKDASTPALNSFAHTGAIDIPGLTIDISRVKVDVSNTENVQSQLGQLSFYWQNRQERGPVEYWRNAIYQEDKADLERMRREQILAAADTLFESFPRIQRVGMGDNLRGWFGAVHHDNRPGGLIISESGSGLRQIWETDSEQQFIEAYVSIVNAQAEWIKATFGGRSGGSEQKSDLNLGELPEDPDATAK
jgi:hypothetical protein